MTVTTTTEQKLIDAPADLQDLGALVSALPNELVGYSSSASEYATWVSGWVYTYATTDDGQEYADGQMLLYCDRSPAAS